MDLLELFRNIRVCLFAQKFTSLPEAVLLTKDNPNNVFIQLGLCKYGWGSLRTQLQVYDPSLRAVSCARELALI